MIFLVGCREQVLHNLKEQDANKVFSTLNSAGIVGSKDAQPDGLWSITVDRSDLAGALKILSEHRVVKSDSGNSRKSSVVSSREAQRFEFERNLSYEIERTLLSIDGVIDARVHLNIPAADPILGIKSSNDEGSASLLLITVENFIVESSKLADLVSGAAGIPSSRISILITPANGEPPLHLPVAHAGNRGWLGSISIEMIAIVSISLLVLAITTVGVRRFGRTEGSQRLSLHSQFKSAQRG